MRNTYRQRRSGSYSRQAILTDAFRVNANLFQTDLCRNPEAGGWRVEITSCSLDTGNPCRYDDFCE
ncbi:MAG: hypothetical protein LUQ56_02430 [Methylococcaceae bacterium]|nr:hypothetical protein [Methylococcaceae bacterium]MDD1636976.1 hypothetical protein [Methylococcaceae bacterium]